MFLQNYRKPKKHKDGAKHTIISFDKIYRRRLQDIFISKKRLWDDI